MLRSLIQSSNTTLQLCRAVSVGNSTIRLQSTDTNKNEKPPKKPTIWQIDEAKCERLANFGRYVAECLPKFVQQVQFASGDELELLIHPSGVLPVMSFLKGNHSAQFTNFIFACGVDVPTRQK